MDDQDDRLKRLFENAELLIEFNTHTGVLPSSRLEETYAAARAEKNLEFESREAVALRGEIARMVVAIKPATLTDIREFAPFTGSNGAGNGADETPKDRIDEVWINTKRVLRPVFYLVTTLTIVVCCAYYTVWAKEAEQFMRDVQAVRDNLASDRFREITDRWATIPVLEESTEELEVKTATVGARREFRIIAEHLETFWGLADRAQTLDQRYRIYNRFHPFKPGNARSENGSRASGTQPGQPSAGSVEATNQTDVGTVRSIGNVVTTERPRTVADATGAVPKPGSKELGTYGDPNSNLRNASVSTGIKPGTAQSYISTHADDQKCIQEFSQTRTDLIQAVVQNSFVRAAAKESKAQRNIRRMSTRAFNGWAAERMYKAHIRLLVCTFKIENRRASRIDEAMSRETYVELIRTIRNRLDILSSWVLPAFYGALGSILMTLQIHQDAFQPRQTFSRIVSRVFLGSFIGLIVGWFWSPQSNQFFEFANVNVGLFAVAFMFGYGIDVFLNLLQRMVQKLAGAVEGGGAKA